MRNNFETLTKNSLVDDLGPDDLIYYARHLFLSSAKDSCKNVDRGDAEMCDNSVNVVLNLQAALEAFSPNHV